MPTLNPVDLVLTDPPYNVGLGSKSHSKRQAGYLSYDDKIDIIEYADMIRGVYDAAMSISPLIIVTPGNSNQHIWPAPKWTIAWTKANGVTRTPLTRGQKMNHACWEPILIYGKLDNPPHSDVVNLPISIQPAAEGHPCPKPIKLFSSIIQWTDASTIIDPFMGSGTTLVAAKDLCKKAIGIEREEKYCEIALNSVYQ